MVNKADYLKNPCGESSIPYWKTKAISVPAGMKILHETEFDKLKFHETDSHVTEASTTVSVSVKRNCKIISTDPPTLPLYGWQSETIKPVILRQPELLNWIVKLGRVSWSGFRCPNIIGGSDWAVTLSANCSGG